MTLKVLRVEAGLSQRELGEALAKALPSSRPDTAYSQPRIAAYESGRNKMSLEVAMVLVKILNRALKKAKSKKTATLETLSD